MSFNVRNWTRDTDKTSPFYWKARVSAICRCIADVKPDVICVQECLPPVVRKIKRKGYKRVGLGVSHLIFVRKGIIGRKHHFSIFMDWCDVGDLRVINVHSRWEKKIAENVVKKTLQLSSSKDAVACGDFNTALSSLQSMGMSLTHARSYLRHPLQDTFINFKNEKRHGEIDHFFLKGLTPQAFRIIREDYGCERMSDHYPIVLELSHFNQGATEIYV